MAWRPASIAFHRQSGRQIGEWQRLVLLAYVVLLTFVMPFVCWGAWADPGHPHRSPHFVFATPPGSGEALSKIVWSLQSYCGSPSSSTLVDARGAGDEGDPAPLAGQSLPDTTLVITLLPILLAGWLLLERLRQYTERSTRVCVVTTFSPTVPTPPPRCG